MIHHRKTFTESDDTLDGMSKNDEREWGGPTDPLVRLGRLVAERREELQLSQSELIERMNATPYRPGVKHPSHISNIENGDGNKLPSIRVLAALALALETNTDYFVGLTNDPKPATDLEDQVVVGVDDPQRRDRLQEIAEMLATCDEGDFAAVAWLVWRLAGGEQRGKRSAPGMAESAAKFADTILTEDNRQDGDSNVRQRRAER